MKATSISGVIEGFYGPPWSLAERKQAFELMGARGLKTFLYAPKDDLKLRARWREQYSANELASLKAAIDLAIANGIKFTYALSPGLDIRYSSQTDLQLVKQRFDQMLDLGVKNFALLFDDIPDVIRPEDTQTMDCLAELQANFANNVFQWLCERYAANAFLFCPTPYCGRMAKAGLGGENYLADLGQYLHPKIQVFWTGPEIISERITVEHIREVAALLKRKPVIWDNLHANDYDGRRFFVGPYSGRASELLNEVAGILINPNSEFPLNYVPISTFADYLDDSKYAPRASYLRHLDSWKSQFDSRENFIALEDLRLFSDCFYLPHEDGSDAINLSDQIRNAIADGSDAPIAICARLRQFCARLAEIENRPLFYAMHRRVWELREELDLIEKFLTFRSNSKNTSKPFTSDFHLPKTYRGSFVARLQQVLHQNNDGSLSTA